MNDPLLDIADALVTALNGETFSHDPIAFTAALTFFPILDLSSQTASATIVRAVPVDDVETRAAHGIGETAAKVKIFIQEKFPAFVDEATDAARLVVLYELSGAMRSFLMAAALSVGGRSAWCLRAAREPAHDMSVLGEAREFLCCLETDWQMFG